MGSERNTPPPRKFTDTLRERLAETHRDLRRLGLRLWGSGLLLVAIGFTIAWFFIEPAPPDRIVIAAGPRDGAYFHAATRYAESLRRAGIELEILETNGSVENYELLSRDEDVHLAIVQGGTTPRQTEGGRKFEAIGSLFLEPLWVFHRSDPSRTDLRTLRDVRIAVGVPGSGTRELVTTVLRENGVLDDPSVEPVDAGGMEAARMLLEGEVDMAFYVGSLEADFVVDLLGSSEVRLMSFDRDDAYTHRHPYLSNVVLPRGGISLREDTPPRDVHLIAPAANLVATPEFHDSLVPLLLAAAAEVHGNDSNLTRPGRFPSTEFVEFPLNESARIWFRSGPPFLQRYLPFWVASAVDRGKVLLIPVLTLLIPFFKLAPPLYRWRIRSRIYRWYKLLRVIEADLRDGCRGERLEQHATTLRELERELDGIESVPLPYMEEFYNLRLHVDFVERRVTRALESDHASPRWEPGAEGVGES